MNHGGPKKWFAVDVTTASKAVEAVEYAFNVLDALGTEISDLRHGENANVCVVGYFESRPDNAIVENAIDGALTVYGESRHSIISIKTRVVSETDWLAEWKKYWQPTVVGKFVIAPPWAELEQTDKIVIRIEPNMAFGTGTHETTQLCLEAIGEHFVDGMSFLDVGTGTGILAIAAAKLSSASPVTGCDTDADSIKIARENAAANEVGDHVQFFLGSIESESVSRTFVCANLTLDVITRLLPTLVASTNGILLLSGILKEQENAIRCEIKKVEISNLKFAYAGEWLSVLIYK